VLRFAPPIGVPVRYRNTTRTIGLAGGQQTPSQTTTSEEELVFAERADGGYLLRWTTKSAKVEAPPDRQKMIQQAVAIGVGKPILIRLSKDGQPDSIENLAEMRASMASAMDLFAGALTARFAAVSEAKRDDAQKFASSYINGFKSLTDEQLSQLLLEEPRILFAAGGLQLTLATPAKFTGRVYLPIANLPVGFLGQAELKSFDPDGTATVVISSATDPAETKAAVLAFTEKMLSSLPPAQRDAASAAIRRQTDGINVTEELRLTLDGRTAVPRSADYTKQTMTSGQGRIEMRTIARID
jgi:hypothetical protein